MNISSSDFAGSLSILFNDDQLNQFHFQYNTKSNNAVLNKIIATCRMHKTILKLILITYLYNTRIENMQIWMFSIDYYYFCIIGHLIRTHTHTQITHINTYYMWTESCPLSKAMPHVLMAWRRCCADDDANYIYIYVIRNDVYFIIQMNIQWAAGACANTPYSEREEGWEGEGGGV